MKVAMTLDGRIAPAPGERTVGQPSWITGVQARAEVQQMRHAADALLSGVETVLADDPLLTDRSGKPRRRPLLRVVLDSSLRTPPQSRLVRGAQNDLLICTVSRDAARRQALESLGARVEVLPEDPETPGRLPLPAVLDFLGKENILTLLTETGSRLNTAFLAADLVDRLTLFIAPRILGSDAVPAFRGLAHPVLLTAAERKQFGNDPCLSALLHDPWPLRAAPASGSLPQTP